MSGGRAAGSESSGPPLPAPAAEVRELRAEIRHWRRGRSSLRLVDVLSEIYIAVFSTAVLGSMAVSVVLNVRRLTGDTCGDLGCAAARNLLPWLVAGLTLAAVIAVARLFGPLFVTPAVASWLLPTPADRAALLRGRLLATTAVALLAGAATALLAGTLGGLPGSTLLVFTVVVGLLAGGCLLLAVVAQLTGARPVTATVRVLALGLGLAAWLGLLLLALGGGPAEGVPAVGERGRVPVAVVLAVLGGLVVLALALARRRLAEAHRHALTPGGRLAPGLSGALASLDLALAFDVIIARVWRDRSSVRSRRGGPRGPAALVWRDVLRLVRSPGVLLLAAASVVVPYVVVAAGLGVAVTLAAALVAFVSVVGLCTSLRVLTRNPGTARLLPFSASTARAASLVVPALVSLGVGLATVPAIVSTGTEGDAALLLGVAVGLSGVAAAARWICGRPPDYDRPLIASPAGAVPTNLYGSALRGFDIWLLTSAPTLLFADLTGAVVSLALSAVVLGYLIGRE